VGVSLKAAESVIEFDGFARVDPRHKIYDPPGLENIYPEAAALGGFTKAGWGLLKYMWNTMTRPVVSTTNTFDANSGFAAGKEFSGGKQNARDASIKQYPSEFQRWYHKFYKGSSRGDASRQELQELYQEWINMGKPQVK
jgi:hypothetical protein